MTTDRDSVSRRGRLSRRVFGLRTLLVVVLAIGGGLGWIVHDARVQREAVATVRRLGGQCRYDWEAQNSRPTPGVVPRWRQWLIDAFGPDYAGSVTQVYVRFAPSSTPTLDDLASIGHLARLEHLSLLNVSSARQALLKLQDLSRLKHLDLFDAGGTEGGNLAPLANFTELEELQLSLPWMSDDDLIPLAGLTRLKHLSLGTPVSPVAGANPLVTDAGLVALEPLHDLRSLQISGENKITDAGLAHIARLTRLENLSLQGEKVTSVEPLRPLVGLKHLNIGGTRFNNFGIDDAGVALIADLPLLSTVILAGSKSFTNGGLAHLLAMPNLVHLDLTGTSVDDVGVASLVEFPKLKRIYLGFTAVTDAGLAALAKRPGFTTIDVGFTKVSPEGVAAAQLALPGTTITHRVMHAASGGTGITSTPGP